MEDDDPLLVLLQICNEDARKGLAMISELDEETSWN